MGPSRLVCCSARAGHGPFPGKGADTQGQYCGSGWTQAGLTQVNGFSLTASSQGVAYCTINLGGVWATQIVGNLSVPSIIKAWTTPQVLTFEEQTLFPGGWPYNGNYEITPMTTNGGQHCEVWMTGTDITLRAMRDDVSATATGIPLHWFTLNKN